MDLSHLSDEELEKMAKGSTHDFSSMSDEELEKLANPKQKSHGFLGALSDIGKKIDSYSGAPTRSAISALQSGDNPLTAFGHQFGADPEKAPTGYDIASKVTDNPYLGTALATAVDFGADPVNLIPGAALEKVAGGIGKTARFGGEALGSVAEKLAKNATGATGRQASKFADDAGRQLLDRGLVRFGDTPEKIAARTSDAMDVAHSDIDSSLKGLDEKGVTASADSVVANLQAKIADLKKDPSQSGLVRKLEGIVDDIIQTGQSNVPISAAEQTKRGFNKMAGNWMDPEAGQAGKQAYLEYMNEVERASQADPALAQKFIQGKETHGLLAPIQEAAEKRASTLNQSPLGGLGDWAAGGVGGATAGGAGAAAALAAKRLVAPRLSSSAAVMADKVSKLLMKSPTFSGLAKTNPAAYSAMVSKFSEKLGGEAKPPQIPFQKTAGDDSEYTAQNQPKPPDSNDLIQKAQGSKFGQVLQNAAQRGNQAVAASHFILQQTQPEYRALLEADKDEEHN